MWSLPEYSMRLRRLWVYGEEYTVKNVYAYIFNHKLLS